MKRSCEGGVGGGEGARHGDAEPRRVLVELHQVPCRPPHARHPAARHTPVTLPPATRPSPCRQCKMQLPSVLVHLHHQPGPPALPLHQPSPSPPALPHAAPSRPATSPAAADTKLPPVPPFHDRARVDAWRLSRASSAPAPARAYPRPLPRP